MAKWDEIYQTVESTAYKAIRKTGEIADTASVHIKLKAISAKLNLKYAELGKLTYKQIKTEKTLAAEITGIISEIDSLRADAKALRDKLEKAKEERQRAKAADDFKDFEDVSEDAGKDSADDTESV